MKWRSRVMGYELGTLKLPVLSFSSRTNTRTAVKVSHPSKIAAVRPVNIAENALEIYIELEKQLPLTDGVRSILLYRRNHLTSIIGSKVATDSPLSSVSKTRS